MIRDIDRKSPLVSEPLEEINLGILLEKVNEILELSGYPEYKMPNTEVMISRLMARANITKSEYFKIMGILRFLRFRLNNRESDKDTPEKLY
jgi:tRNA C32,U32 (ribose-2'-O)-methylase TrmJ